MKSPTSSVGRIDEDGILNGSATNERSRKTISRTGKKLFGYSIHHGSRAPAGRRFAKTSLSARAMHPVATVARNRISAKFIVYPPRLEIPALKRDRAGPGCTIARIVP